MHNNKIFTCFDTAFNQTRKAQDYCIILLQPPTDN